jgi:hypothetical protein
MLRVLALQITQDRLACPDDGILIPPLTPSFKFGCVGYDWTAAEDAHVVLLHFHFHGLGKRISYAVQHADGRASPHAPPHTRRRKARARNSRGLSAC